MSWFKLSDVDAGYHIAYGRHFLATGKIVESDPFLLEKNRTTFVNANWGSQVIMAWLDDHFGVTGLTLLRSLLLLTIFVAIAFIARSVCKSWHAVAWAWLLAAMAGYERFSMRPELFSYAILTVQVAIVLCCRRSRASAITLILLQLLWVNLHSYFLVGIIVVTALQLGLLLAEWWDGSSVEFRSKLRFFELVLAGQVLVCLANPWLWRGATFPIDTLLCLKQSTVLGAADAPKNAWSEISEFRSPYSFAGEPINYRTVYAYYAVLAVAACGVVLLTYKRRLGEAFVVILLGVMSFQMRRNIAQFAFIASPLSIAAMVLFASGAMRSLSALARVVSTAAVCLSSVYCITGITSGYFYFVERRVNREWGSGFSDSTYLHSAVQWIAAHSELQPNLFVDYFASSNTLLWLPERFKLFVDTNTFAYPEPVLRIAFDVGLARVSHEKFFDEQGINVALLHAGPDTQLLIRRLVDDYTNWALVYVDPWSVIFVRRIPQHVQLILANSPTENSVSVDDWVKTVSGGKYQQAQTICLMANVPISLGWTKKALVILDQALRRTDDYPQAWYLAALAHANLGKAAGRNHNFAELKIQYKAAHDFAARALTLDPNNAEAARILSDMKEQLATLSRLN